MYACLYRPPAPNENPQRELKENDVIAIAREFSPRYQTIDADAVLIDVSGLGRLFGAPRAIGEALAKDAARRGVRVHVALAGTYTAARILAMARPGVTVVVKGSEADVLASLAIGILEKVTPERESLRSSARISEAADALAIFRAWGLKTLGDLAALPVADLAARLGRAGGLWQSLARGEDLGPLVPDLLEERFDGSIDLDWPIEGLEPLSFVLTRLLEPLSTRLERRDRGAAVLHVRLGLVTEDEHARRLDLPAPIRDVRTLRTLALLDLESHPPAAAIDRVTVVIDPTPGRVLQHTLFTRVLPTPEQLSTLVARLGAVMGQDRIGAPTAVDSHRPGAFAMRAFASVTSLSTSRGAPPPLAPAASLSLALEPRLSRSDEGCHHTFISALRRCRQPVPARVAVDHERPVRVTTDRRGFVGGMVVQCAGPWRTSGEWWAGEAGRAGEGYARARQAWGGGPTPSIKLGPRHLIATSGTSRSATAPSTGSFAIATPTPGSSTRSPTDVNLPLQSADYPITRLLNFLSCISSSTPRRPSVFSRAHHCPKSLVERAAALGYPALALVDRDGVYGAPRFHKAALAAGIRPIIGAELTMGTGCPARPRAGCCLCSANPQEGYRNLCQLITRMKMRAPKGEGALALEDLDGHTRGLVALVGRAALDGRRYGVGGLLDRVTGIFGRGHVYVELQRHFRREEEDDVQALAALAAAFRVPVIATGGVRFAASAERPLFDVLTCIHHHTDLAQAGRRLAPNAERYLKPPADMAALFSDRPDAVRATRELADRLQYTMADLGYRFPDYPVPSGETQASFLRKMTEVGARDRYRPVHDRARAQLTRELDLIEKLELAGYFLIVWDIVNFCRREDILVQGRGSAANSAVCYSLGITAVDPVQMDLLFERFLSEERGEWPDIDLDLPSGDRRERVIQHVHEKIHAPAGEGPRAAMTANVITYRGRSAAREVGKALGFEAAQIDRLAKVMNNFEFTDAADALPRHLASVGLDLHAERVRHFARLWGEMQDLPRHLGQHSGGMVICQGRLDAVVPLENASMPGRVVVQWDKDDCADMGIVKVDLLGLGMMAALQDALALVNSPAGATIATARTLQ